MSFRTELQQLKGAFVLVLGLGKSGAAAAAFNVSAGRRDRPFVQLELLVRLNRLLGDDWLSTGTLLFCHIPLIP